MVLASWSWYALQSAVASGHVVALASVCLLQYAWHVLWHQRRDRELEKVRSELSEMEDVLSTAQRDRSLAKIENLILHDFLIETDSERCLHLLLRHFVPHPDHNWAVFIELHPVSRWRATRGLSEPRSGVISFDNKLLNDIPDGEPLILTGANLLQCRWLLNLPPADRSRLEKLFIFRVGSVARPLGVIIASELFPVGVPYDMQIQLVDRLLQLLARQLEGEVSRASQEQQLRLSTDQLAVRNILDRTYSSPLEMMQTLLSHLKEPLQVERGALFLIKQGVGLSNTPFASTALNLSPGIREKWLQFESQLANSGLSHRQPISFDHQQLLQQGIRSLLGGALVLPIRQNDNTLGLVVFSRHSRVPFDPALLNLADWALQLLAEKMFHAVHQAQIERQARQDGLTQLANRRTFDVELGRELQAAHGTCSELSLVLIDIDRFKSVNDTYGHQAGDHVLRVVSDIMQSVTSQLRSGDRALCARYGGEELAIILPGMGGRGAARIAEVVRERTETTLMEFENTSFRVTLSAGVSTYPFDGATDERLINAADGALYKAKTTGRNKVLLAQDVAEMEAAATSAAAS